MQRNDSTTKLFEAIKNYNAGNAVLSEDLIKVYLKDADLTATNSKGCTPIQSAARLRHWEIVKIIANTKPANLEDKERYNSALYEAVLTENEEMVKFLLSREARPSWGTNSDGNCCIHWAVKKKNLPIIKLLQNKSKYYVNKAGQTAMQLAAAEGYWDGVKVMADNEKTDEKDGARYTDVLFSAIEAHNPAKKTDLSVVIISLINAGANLAGIKNEKTPIEVAYKLGKLDCVQTIAQAQDATQNDPERYGHVLWKSLFGGKDQLVEPLLKAKASADNVSRVKDNSYSLHAAVIVNKPAMIELLLNYHAFPYPENLAGQTPLELACELGHWECAAILTTKVSNYHFNKSEISGLAFVSAIKAGQLKIAKHLINFGALTTYQTEPDEFTALHWAVQENNREAIRFLLENGASLNEVNANNETPFELACELGHLDCAQELIENEASLENWSSRCNSALRIAVTHNQPEIVELLIAKGADANGKIKNGNKTQTLKELARELGYSKCLEVLNETKINEKYLNFSELIKLQDKLFKSLRRNDVDVQDLPETISSLIRCEVAILHEILQGLRERIDGNEEENEFLIVTINTMLKSSHQLSQAELDIISNMKIRGSVNADYVDKILSHQQSVDDYVEKIKKWLLAFKQEIQKTKWQVRDYGIIAAFESVLEKKVVWKEGMPKHLEVILKHLEKLNNINLNRLDILNLFLLVHQQLSGMGQDATRHVDTRDFYERKIQECREIRFAERIREQNQYYLYSNIQTQSCNQAFVPVFWPTEYLHPEMQTQSTSVMTFPPQYETQANYIYETNRDVYPPLSECPAYVLTQQTTQPNIDIPMIEVEAAPKLDLPIEIFELMQKNHAVVNEGDAWLQSVPEVPTHTIYLDRNPNTLYVNAPTRSVENTSEERKRMVLC